MVSHCIARVGGNESTGRGYGGEAGEDPRVEAGKMEWTKG